MLHVLKIRCDKKSTIFSRNILELNMTLLEVQDFGLGLVGNLATRDHSLSFVATHRACLVGQRG
jgi:hypothetical protein